MENAPEEDWKRVGFLTMAEAYRAHVEGWPKDRIADLAKRNKRDHPWRDFLCAANISYDPEVHGKG